MSALPSLRQLSYLVALSEHLNFTRAAEACFVGQSTLSAGLKELEETLGVRLVERDRQTVLMTPIGIEATRRARAILSAAQDLSELARGAAEPMSGSLKLGAIPTIAPFVLPAALERLRAAYPRLRLALREDLTANLLERLEDGRLDFALIALPYPTERLLVEPLYEDPFCLVGRRDDPALGKARAGTLPELDGRLLLLEEGHCLRDHALQACGNAAPGADAGLEATSLLTLIQMIESGLGLGLLPQMAIAAGLADSPALLTRPLGKEAPNRTIALVARQSSARLEEMRAVADVLRESATLRRTRPPKKSGH